jgi:hypothetical protein
VNLPHHDSPLIATDPPASGPLRFTFQVSSFIRADSAPGYATRRISTLWREFAPPRILPVALPTTVSTVPTLATAAVTP